MTGTHGEEIHLKQTLPGDMTTLKGSGMTEPGVEGKSQRSNGVYGSSADNGASGVYGDNTGGGIGVGGRSPQGVGVFGEGGRLAGQFIGDVEVTGDIRLTNADCAEDFDVQTDEHGTSAVEPGTVMVLDREGAVRPSGSPYDKRVAGVVSGAGSYKPGIVLDRHESDARRMPIALMGKVFCMVDADYSPVEVGDLLTTSPTPGHAMKATDTSRAFGAVIGKALRPMPDGQGLIPILVALQ